MNQELRNQIQEWISRLGISFALTDTLWTVLQVVAALLLVAVVYWLVHRVAVRFLNRMIVRSPAKWDDAFMRRRVLEKSARVIPIWLASLLLPLALNGTPDLAVTVGRILRMALIIPVLHGLFAALDAVQVLADAHFLNRRLPVRSFLQLLKLLFSLVGLIVAFSILSNHTPLYFLGSIGVATGLAAVIFRDTILGFVAGIQLAANRMVSPGDWIQMDKHGADGTVLEVTLTTVKVRNWDNTLIMIPAYALISDSFCNWRGMTESGGRRIKRAIPIDVASIHFLSDEELARLGKINVLQEYLARRTTEIAAANARIENADMPVNVRKLTNIGTFRAYVGEFLRRHARIHSGMLQMVRQLPPGPQGLPVEIYCFTNDIGWATYEDIQSDVFDHLLAILPQFGLRAFQHPAGHDLNRFIGIREEIVSVPSGNCVP